MKYISLSRQVWVFLYKILKREAFIYKDIPERQKANEHVRIDGTEWKETEV